MTTLESTILPSGQEEKSMSGYSVTVPAGPGKRVWLRRLGDEQLWYVLQDDGRAWYCETADLLAGGLFPRPDSRPDAAVRGCYWTWGEVRLTGVREEEEAV